MGRSGCAIETLEVNMNKGYGHQKWASKIPRGSYLVETMKPCDSVHESTKH